MEKCRKCKHYFISISKIEKCYFAKTELGHAVIYGSCKIERGRDDGCGSNAKWFEEM